MANKNVLIFAPYGAWTVHHQVDAVLGAALQLRGCEVRALVCDGFFESCPIANGDRSCAECFKTATDLFSSFGLEMIGLRSLVGDDDLSECRAWAEGLSKEDFLAATFEGAAIGKWVSGSMYSSLLTGSIDLEDEHVARMNRTLIFNGALLKRAYDRYRKELVPDHVFCYSGFHPFYRIILRLSREKGLPVLVHERGETRDSFVLLDSESLHESESRLLAWENWKDIPLSQDECLRMKTFCADREGGRDFNVFQNYTFKTEGDDVRERLRIPPQSNIVAVFPTCDWEVGIKKYDIAPTRFERQMDWLAHLAGTVDLENTYLVIRLHPALVRRDVMPASILKDLFSLSRTLNQKSRVRVIMPYERVTSYSLIQHAAAALTWSSTVGIEAVLRGVATASEVYCHKSIVGIKHVDSADYNQTIINTMERTSRFDLNDLRVAYRGAYYHFFRLNFIFKSFGIRDVYMPDIRIKQLSDLSPGNDATLDHVCNHVMSGSSLYPVPTYDDRKRPETEEKAFLEAELEELQKRRAIVKGSMPIDQPNAVPLLTVLRVQYEGKNYKDTFLHQTIKRSRHKNIEHVKMALPWACDSARFVSELNAALKSATGDFVYLANDNTHVDESLFSSAVDFLEGPKNENFAGVLSGVWICDRDGNLKGEMFTERKHTNDYAELIRTLPLMERPEHLFSCFVWRMPQLRDLAHKLASRLPASQDVSQAVFEQSLFERSGANCHKTLIPNVIIHVSPDGILLRTGEIGSVNSVGNDKSHEVRHKPRHPSHDEPANRMKKELTLLQMNTYYPAFLNEVYSKTRGLEKRPFKEQMSIILDQGFGAIHAFVPHIDSLGYSSEFIIANNPHSQLRWALEHGIHINPKANWLDEVLKIQIESMKPDILLMMDAFKYDSRFVRELSVKPPLIAGWSGEYVPPQVSWSGYDMILSNFKYVLAQAISKGAATARSFHPGFLKWLYDEVREISPDYDVVFVGQWSDLHRKRNELVAEVAKEALRTRKFSLALYLSGDRHTMPPEVQECYRGECFGLAMHRALRSGRIALNAETTPNLEIVKEAGNMRMFETTGTGVFLLTQYHDNISDYFIPGQEIETFRDKAELIKEIHYYLAHPEKRESIARRGQERCLQHYSMEKQLQKLDRLFRTYLSEKEDASHHVPSPTQAVSDDGQAIAEKDAVHINVSEENLEVLKEIAKKQRFGHWCVICSGHKIYCQDLLSSYQRAKDIIARRVYDSKTDNPSPELMHAKRPAQVSEALYQTDQNPPDAGVMEAVSENERSGENATTLLSGIDKRSWAQRQISDELEFWKRPESFEPLEGYPDYRSRLLDITKNMFGELRTDFRRGTVCEVGGGAYGGLLSLMSAKSKLMIDPLLPKYLTVEHDFTGIFPIAACAEDIPLPSESIDACICTNALDHMYSPYEALKEMYRIIKPGGYLALAVDVGGTPGHPIAIEKDDLEKYLDDAHFEIIERRCSPDIRSTWPAELKIPLYVFQGRKVEQKSSENHILANCTSNTRPVSSLFGCDRGTPIDRYYIEKFLERNRHSIHGRVLEIGDNIYTRKYGSQVSRSDVLGYNQTPKTTIVGDLSTGENIPMMAFDCIIMTQTIQFIYDVKSAIKNAFGALNPGGRLLITTSGLSQISRYDMERWGDYWRFTDKCLKMLLGEVFESNKVDIDKYGNVAVAKAFLDGYALHETDPAILDICDPDYQIIVAATACK